MSEIPMKTFAPTAAGNPILAIQTKHSRALNVGYLKQMNGKQSFVPGRLLFGTERCAITHNVTLDTLALPQVKKIIQHYKPEQISTVTVLRETLACRIADALYKTGVHGHYGDAFIGATHIKDDGPIRTAYLYENIEGLVPDGLWVIAESFCTGRNLYATMQSLLAKFTPAEILFVAPIASRRAIEYIDSVIAPKKIPTTYVTWGALFGVDEKTLYDMPWGHQDTEPLDTRDRDFFNKMFSPIFCVGGDFGNNYYSPPKALAIYNEELKTKHVTPHIPTVEEVFSTYKTEEILALP